MNSVSVNYRSYYYNFYRLSRMTKGSIIYHQISHIFFVHEHELGIFKQEPSIRLFVPLRAFIEQNRINEF